MISIFVLHLRAGTARPFRAASSLVLCTLLFVAGQVGGQELPSDEVPLVVGNRTIHVFRSRLGDLTAQERVEVARRHIGEAFERSGDGWMSIAPVEEGYLVQLDGVPVFTVTDGDARGDLGETSERLANHALRVLRKAWSESRESQDMHATGLAALKVAVALLVLFVTLFLLLRVSSWLRRLVTKRLSGHVNRLSHAGLGARMAKSLLVTAARTCVVLTWLLDLLAVYVFFAYSLSQFALTRPIGENLSHSLETLLAHALKSVAGALPGLFVAIMIFLIARIATQISRGVFDQVTVGRLELGSLDAHTAPATRQIVNAAIWLFAIAMAYSYLPGAQTDAFKGLSVILGIMVSIGAAGLVGQVASGMILVFTRSLLVGEYVRIQDCEGTVTYLGPFVTRIRNGLGEEIVLPNSLVVANVTRNFSRVAEHGFVLNAAVTIGYDTPWRQVHALLIEATKQVPLIKRDPAPYVVQTALSDFYVSYCLVAHANSAGVSARAGLTSDLYAAIQDLFNKQGVQIMSPHYVADPEAIKIVPESRWQGESVKGHSTES